MAREGRESSGLGGEDRGVRGLGRGVSSDSDQAGSPLVGGAVCHWPRPTPQLPGPSNAGQCRARPSISRLQPGLPFSSALPASPLLFYLLLLFYNVFIFNWRIIGLQCCVCFCIHQHESAVGIHRSPLPRASLHLPPHVSPVGCPRAPGGKSPLPDSSPWISGPEAASSLGRQKQGLRDLSGSWSPQLLSNSETCSLGLAQPWASVSDQRGLGGA